MLPNFKNSLVGMLAWLLVIGTTISDSSALSGRLQIDFQKKNTVTKIRPVSPPSKIHRYCKRLFNIYDKDADGWLKENEWRTMKGSPAKMDANRDRLITLREFERYVFDFGKNRSIRLVDPVDEEGADGNPNQINPTANKIDSNSEEAEGNKQTTQTKRRTDARFHINASRSSANLPPWFLQKDKNGDGQISLNEYSARRTNAELKAFRALDTNNDGLITSRELSRTGKKKKGSKN